MRLLTFIICSLFLTSCAKYADGSSVWSKGLWLVALLPFLGSLWFFYTAYVASKSNSTQQSGVVTSDNTGNVPMYKTGRFLFGVVLLVATIVIIWVVNSNK